MEYFHTLSINLVVLGRRLRPVSFVLAVLFISSLVCAGSAFLISSILTSYTSSYHERGEGIGSIWRVDTLWTSAISGESGVWATSPAPIAKLIRSGYGDRFHVSSFTSIDSQLKIDNLGIPFDNIFINEGPTLNAFEWDVISGVEPHKLLPGQALITAKSAEILFGQESAIGKKIRLKVGGVYKKEKTFSVASVVKEFLGNTIFQPQIIVVQDFPDADMKTMHSGGLRGLPVEWFKPNAYTYIRRIEPAKDSQAELAELDSLISTIENNTPDLNDWTPEFLYRSPFDAKTTLGIYENPLKTLPVATLYLLGIVALLLVFCCLISTFFFFGIIGLLFKSVLMSMYRIGVPKTQNSVLLGIICLIFSLIVCWLSLMAAEVFGYQILSLLNVRSSTFVLSSLNYSNLIVWLFLLIFLTAMAALYSISRSSTPLLQRVFIVTSLVLGVWASGISALFYLQQEHMNDKDLGFTPENVFILTVKESNILAPKLNLLKQRIGKIEGVKSVYAAQNIPGDTDYKYLELRSFDQIGAISKRIQAISAEPGLMEALGVPLMHGSYRAPHESNNDHTLSGRTKPEILINSTAASLLGFNNIENIVNKRLTMFNSDDVNQTLRVTGVLDDFNFLPPIVPIEPLLTYQQPQEYRKLVVFFEPSTVLGLANKVLDEWSQVFPTIHPNTYYLKSRYDNYGNQYAAVMKISIFGCALSLVGVFISLFGSMRFTTLCRRREVAIRRIVGAKVNQLGGLYVNQYLIPAIIGLPCALLATILAGSAALNPFAYRINVFDPQILSYLVITMLTTGLCGVVMSFLLEIPNFNRREYATLNKQFSI